MGKLERKGLGLCLLLGMALLLCLLPVREARADGATPICPCCGQASLEYRRWNSLDIYWCPNCCYYAEYNLTGGDLESETRCSGGKATCTEKAKCIDCEKEYGKPLGHAWTLPNKARWFWDDQTDTGYAEIPYYCSRAGCNEEVVIHVEPAKRTITTTCTSGSAYYEVFVSKEKSPDGSQFTWSETVPVPPLGHDLKGIDRAEPTCTAPGTEAYWMCQRSGCGKLFSDSEGKTEIEAPKEIPALNHDWGAWTPDPNMHYRVCQRAGCNAKKTEVHHADAIVNDGPAEHYYVCEVCKTGGFMYGREPHIFGEWQDFGDGTNHYRECFCFATEFEEHSGGTPTCTSGPVCGKCNVEYDAPLGHDWGSWSPDDELTHSHLCQRNGCGEKETEAHHADAFVNDAPAKHYYVCEVCVPGGFMYGGEPHSFGEWQDFGDGTYHYRECLCLATEFEEHSDGTATCTSGPVCGKCSVEYGAPLGHEWVYDFHPQWFWDDETDTGYVVLPYSCKRAGCNGNQLIKVAAERIITATCEDSGLAHYTATISEEEAPNGVSFGISRTVDVPPLGHDLKGIDREEPTCTAPGTEAYWMCQRSTCGKLFSDSEGKNEIEAPKEIPALNHDWGAWSPDPDDAEKHSRLCQRNNCGEKETKAHSYAWTYVDDDNCKGVCACGAETTEAHYDRWEGYCDYQPHCGKCDHDYGVIPEHDMYYEDLGESGHKPTCYNCDTWFFPEPHSGGTRTCTEKATCEKCHEEYGDPLGHDLTPTAKKDANCTEDGTEAYWTCQRENCRKLFSDDQGRNEIPEPVVIPAKGHAPGKAVREKEVPGDCVTPGTYDEVVYCESCGLELSRTGKSEYAGGHQEEILPGQAPACVEPGWTEGVRCALCGEVLTAREEIPALGHDYREVSRTIIRVTLQCARCGDQVWTLNAFSRSILPGLVRNAQDENVDYTAGVTSIDGELTLTIVPDAAAVEDSPWISLWIKPEDAAEWLRQEVTTVAFVCGDVKVEIDLAALTAVSFEQEGKIDAYVLTVAPEEDGWLVTLQAAIGDETTPARPFHGVTLTVRGQTILITENGIF